MLVNSGKRPDPTGQIVFEKVPPGIARLELHSQAGSAPVGELSGVAVVAGETVYAGLLGGG